MISTQFRKNIKYTVSKTKASENAEFYRFYTINILLFGI